MSRYLSKEYGQFLRYDDPIVTALPFTIGGWINSDDEDTYQRAWSVCDQGTEDEWFLLSVENSGSGQRVGASHKTGGTASSPWTTELWRLNVWHHICGVYASTTSRFVYLDGRNKVEATASKAFPVNLDSFVIGCKDSSIQAHYISGLVGEWGLIGLWLCLQVKQISKIVCYSH